MIGDNMYRKNNKNKKDSNEDKESSFDGGKYNKSKESVKSINASSDKDKYEFGEKERFSNDRNGELRGRESSDESDFNMTMRSDTTNNELEPTENEEHKDTGMDKTLSILIHSFNEPVESSIEAYHVRELDSFLMSILKKNSLDYTLILADYEAQDLMNAYDIFLNAIFKSIIRIDSDILLKEGLVTTRGYEDNFDSDTLYLSNPEEEESE